MNVQDKISPAEMQANAAKATELLKSLAHENRLLILCQLADGEKSVSQLAQLLSVRQPTLSQHLARLRAEELVATRRDGNVIYYRLANEQVRPVIEVLYDTFCS
ncbi:MAG: metalloregulator ArsR/SmtB family transcription factor [Alphaproteobacteria bacterium]|nr:metalloregulator ArsR/SmtB family transcription factor [Alphaproteobacteria bacterium]